MQYELTKEEIRTIKKAMIHSGNIFKTFCEQSSMDYPIESTNKYINEINRIIDSKGWRHI